MRYCQETVTSKRVKVRVIERLAPYYGINPLLKRSDMIHVS